MQKLIPAAKNWLIALDRFAWPGLETDVFSDAFSAPAPWFRENWYDPRRVSAAGIAAIQKAWADSQVDPGEPREWVRYMATRVVELLGEEGRYLDYLQLQAEVVQERASMQFLTEQYHAVQMQVVRSPNHQLHPSLQPESIP